MEAGASGVLVRTSLDSGCVCRTRFVVEIFWVYFDAQLA